MSGTLQLFDALPPHIEAALRASIERFGVLVPVVRDQHGRTLDGHHRARIAKSMGVEPRVDVVRVRDDDEAREIAHTLNSDRRHLTPEQRREVAVALREQGHSYRAIAGALGVSTGTVRTDSAGVQDYTPAERVVGLDGKSYRSTRPTTIATKGGREETRARALAASSVDLPLAALDLRDVAAAERAMKRAAPVASATPLPPGKFSVLLADPPWRYDFAEADSRAVENQYPTLTAPEIADYEDATGRRVRDMPADDAVLYLWAPNPKLTEALDVLTGWGFEYVTNLVWIKDRVGMGYWARQRHELLLVGKRGDMSPPPERLRPDSVISAPRGGHSVKPSVVHELLEAIWPDAPKVEVFARSERPGWAVMGNQIETAA